MKKARHSNSRLFKFYDQNIISREIMVCGDRYGRDCELANRDNMSKCKYDGAAADMKNFSKSNKEPIQAQLDAAKRVGEVKVRLLKRSVYINARNRKINKHLLDIAYYFFEGASVDSRPFELKDVKDFLGMNNTVCKERFVEVLEIICDYYKDLDKRRR